MEKEEIQKLFKKYHDGKCTEEEKALLESWYLQLNEHELDLTPKKIEAIENRMFRELPGNEFKFIEIGMKLLAAVALIGIIIGVSLKLSVHHDHAVSLTKANDILPGRNTAMLTLSNGQKINLSSAGNGQIAYQSGITIFKTTSGQITYKGTVGQTNPNDTISNLVSTPNGGQWQVTLPDGSKVWLNSAASLKYPVTFTDRKERIVQLTGEAYFEVAKDKLHPFIVKTGQQTVTVLGTHFDINAYPDEPYLKTTLAEGSVKVSLAGGLPQFLVPGQQAIVKDQKIKISEANVEEALAWKNGYFRFNDENIKSVMRKLARWYNIEVQYDPNITKDGMNGKVSRYKNIDQVLSALEATQTVHFKVEGRRVTVMK